jgi:hypothetical protein
MERQADIGEMPADATATRPQRFTHRQYLRHTQHRYPGEFNKRTRGGKRAAALVKQFMCELGIVEPTTVQRLAIERAACLQALSEDTLLRKVGGDTAITSDELIRIDHAAERALKALGIGIKAEAEPTPSLADIIRQDWNNDG